MSELFLDYKHCVVGTKQVLRAHALGRLECVYIARDADAYVQKKIRKALGEFLPVHEAASMKELGAHCRIGVGAACAGALRRV